LYKIGEIYLSLGEFQSAQIYLNEALPLATNDLHKHIAGLLQSISESKKNLEAAKSDQDINPKVVIFAPEEVQKMLGLARQQLRDQQFEKALKLLLKANAIHETPAANRYIGEILLHYRNEDALIFLKKAFPYHSSNPFFVSTMCYAGIQFSELELAKEMLQKLKQLEPEHKMIGELENEILKKAN
jgi:tetratricopeptide (TPR) repeat protein